MRRTKQWWAALTKGERSELHHLEHAMSSWIYRHQAKSDKCDFCQGPWHESGICPTCRIRRLKLIKMANEATQCNPR